MNGREAYSVRYEAKPRLLLEASIKVNQHITAKYHVKVRHAAHCVAVNRFRLVKVTCFLMSSLR